MVKIRNINAESSSGNDGTNDEEIPNLRKNMIIAGCLYLTFILSTFVVDYFAVFLMKDADAVINRIIENEWQFTLGLITNLLSALFFLLSAWALYVLLKPVNKNLALSFLILNLVGVVIQCMAVHELFGAIQLLGGAEYLNVIQAEQLHAQALVHINMYENGFIMAQLFYGAWLLPLGYLVYKSTFLPKWLGILLMVDFVAIVGWFFLFFLFPSHEVIIGLCLTVSLIAELALGGLLLVKGFRIKRSKKEIL